MIKKLLIISSDRISVLIQKGETVLRYYNPGNLFNEVHIIITNCDQPDPTLIQMMVGDARLYVYNIVQPDHFFRNTLGWQYPLMQSWVHEVLDIVHKIQPHLVRTYNNFLDGYLALQIKKKFGIPYVISLHGIWDIDDLTNFKSKVHRFFRKKIEMFAELFAPKHLCITRIFAVLKSLLLKI